MYSWQSDDIDGDNVADNHCWNTFVPFSVTSDLPLFVINWPSCATTINVGIPVALNRSVRSLDAKNDKIYPYFKFIGSQYVIETIHGSKKNYPISLAPCCTASQSPWHPFMCPISSSGELSPLTKIISIGSSSFIKS